MQRQLRLHPLDGVVRNGHPQVGADDRRQQAFDEPEQVTAADDQHQVAHRHRKTNDREQTQEDAEDDPRVLRLDPVQQGFGIVPEGIDHKH